MPYEPKPLSCDPSRLNGLSERLIRGHWENNDLSWTAVEAAFNQLGA